MILAMALGGFYTPVETVHGDRFGLLFRDYTTVLRNVFSMGAMMSRASR